MCVSNEIIEEYLEILSQKVGERLANNVIELIVNRSNVEFVNPTYRFGLVKSDVDDNKFVDCAIASNALFIVSEDKHFRELEKVPFPKVEVIGIDRFLQYLSRKI